MSLIFMGILWNICHHKYGIDSALPHLVCIYLYFVQKRLFVVDIEIGGIDPLRYVIYNIYFGVMEKHRRIAVRINYKRSAVYRLGSIEYLCLTDKPTKYIQMRVVDRSGCIAPHTRQMLGVPLHSQDGIVDALYRLAYTVVGMGNCTQTVGNTLHSLMVYTVYI